MGGPTETDGLTRGRGEQQKAVMVLRAIFALALSLIAGVLGAFAYRVFMGISLDRVRFNPSSVHIA